MKNVWIVDDDRSIRWVLEKALSREGLPWRSFENAIDVQNALENETDERIITRSTRCSATSRTFCSPRITTIIPWAILR